MFLRIGVILLTVMTALMILVVSVLRTASIKHSFYPPANDSQFKKELSEIKDSEVVIDYQMPNPGSILPDHPAWSIKVLRDKFWLFLTRDSGKKAELNLLFADKRLISSKILFEKNKSDIAFSTLLKAREYFKESLRLEAENRKAGYETSEFATKLANASLKHRRIIDEILLIAPEDAKPKIVELQVYTLESFNEASSILESLGYEVPVNPYNGE
jgi:hypothetical protein